MIDNYTRVKLLSPKYVREGASQGDIGSIVEVYGNGEYEVEFADKDGVDYAQIVAREEELQVAEDKPRPAIPGTANAETETVKTHV